MVERGRRVNLPCLRVYDVQRIDQLAFIVPDYAMEDINPHEEWFFVSAFMSSARGEDTAAEDTELE